MRKIIIIMVTLLSVSCVSSTAMNATAPVLVGPITRIGQTDGPPRDEVKYPFDTTIENNITGWFWSFVGWNTYATRQTDPAVIESQGTDDPLKTFIRVDRFEARSWFSMWILYDFWKSQNFTYIYNEEVGK
jgi:hypothetical protein